jgi:phytanoyl-CoA hydroxylase
MTSLAEPSTRQQEEYRTRGYTIVRNAFPPAALDPLRSAIARALDELAASLKAEGKITDLHAEASIEDRLLLLIGDGEFGRSWDDPVFGPELHGLVSHPAILGQLQGLIGPRIRFDGGHRLRPKLPHSELTAFPWHQDSQYYGVGTEHLHVVSVWVPLVDVDEQNGCLWFIPGSHRWGLQQGARGTDLNIRMAEDVESRGTPEPAVMRRGDLVCFSNLTVHGSRVNHTERVRWSIDLRYSADRADDPDSELVRRARALYSDRLEQSDPGFRVTGPGAPESFATWCDRRAAIRNPKAQP